MNRFGLSVLFLLTVISKFVFSQNISNEGTDFWAVFPTHVPSGTSLAALSIFVTSKYNTEVSVSCGTYSEKKPIPANSAVQFDVPRANAYVDLSEQNSILINRGIHIQVTAGMQKVSTYAHIYAGRRSAASLILPFETLGQNYYSVNYKQIANQGNNYLAIVAVEDNTSFVIHEKNGSLIKRTLPKKGDVYEYVSSTNDLTGVYVETDPDNSNCKRFAAFSGSSNTAIGDNANPSGSDPLFQQIYPVSSLGKTYGVVPFHNQSYFYRAIASVDNTTIYQDGALVAKLNKGEFYTSSRISSGIYVTGNNNFLLSQYMYSVNNSSPSGTSQPFGDPDMVLLNSIEFNINNITVFSSEKQEIKERYINVLIKTNQTSSFKVNGVQPAVAWTVLTGNPNYSYAQIPVSVSSITLSASDGFNAIAYGYGTVESYAYSAGTNLASNNYLTVVNNSKSTESKNACVGAVSEFKITLPYQADYILWTLDADSTINQKTPIPLGTKDVNGQTFYIYKSPYSQKYSTAGDHKIEVTAHVSNNAANCASGDPTSNYIFTVYDLPTATFTVDPSGCAKSDIVFTDQSTANSPDFIITDWLWDFGDNTTSTVQNPKHQYATEGDYKVSLVVKSSTGCFSDPAPFQNVHINPLPESIFNVDHSTTCINTDVLFTDQSKISVALTTTSKIVNWHWDFGDGTSVDKTDKLPFFHQFTQTGTFPIVLTTTSDNGCINISSSQNIMVTTLPVANFTLPNICFDDGIAKFINTSLNTDSTTNGLKYEWNFGESSSANNKSSLSGGEHTYQLAGDYFIMLKVKNQFDCEVSQTQNFTINGQVKIADFTIQNEKNLCSNNEVIINNTSSAVSGIITKIDIYQDFVNNPTSKQTIDFPTSSDISLHYPVFGGADDKSFTIKLVVYSGLVCSKPVSKTIVLKPSPIIQFDSIPSVCTDNGTVLINQATETSGIVGGTAVYTSDEKGLDKDGNYNLKLAGEGTHNITYTYTTLNGCALSVTKSITVNKSPSADAGPEIYMLAGGEIPISATAQGNNLTYLWSPALGLSNNKILNPLAFPEKDTEYTLTVTTNPEGCTATAKVLIKVLQALSPPNTFTPNGDNVNDVWNIKYLESYPKATVEVFNTNGTRVYFSDGYKVPFDGNYQNQPLPVGVYYYIINPKNGRKTLTGPLTIIR